MVSAWMVTVRGASARPFRWRRFRGTLLRFRFSYPAGVNPLVRDRLGHVGGLAGAVFDRAVGLFQVQAEGLRTDFPPLRALDASPGSLRPAATSLIGRESEVAEVQAAVKAHRLVTLTGVGGVGKTRLAVEVGASGR